MKTLIILGNAVGGVGTTTTAVHISAALQTLGYSVQLLDGDVVSRAATSMCPSAIPVDASNHDGVRQIFSDIRRSKADTIVLDSPVRAHSAFKRFFTSNHSSLPEMLGIRVIVGTVTDQTEYSVVGAAVWTKAFPEGVDNLLIVNSIGTPDKNDARRRHFQSYFAGRVAGIPNFGEPNSRRLHPQKALSSVIPLARWLTGLDIPHP